MTEKAIATQCRGTPATAETTEAAEGERGIQRTVCPDTPSKKSPLVATTAAIAGPLLVGVSV